MDNKTFLDNRAFLMVLSSTQWYNTIMTCILKRSLFDRETKAYHLAGENKISIHETLPCSTFSRGLTNLRKVDQVSH